MWAEVWLKQSSKQPEIRAGLLYSALAITLSPNTDEIRLETSIAWKQEVHKDYNDVYLQAMVDV